MRKIIDYVTSFLLILSILATYIIEPMQVSAASKATTLAGLREELTKLQKEKKENQNSVASTQSEINSKNKAIAKAYNDIEESENKIEISKREIEDSNNKIANLKGKTEDILSLYVLTKNNDAYLEYISNSSSISELIMRSDAIEEIVSYNHDKIVELEQLITTNENLQVELLNYETELESNISTYQTKVSSLKSDLAYLVDISEDIDDQIKNQKALIDWYEKIGCKENQDLDECVNMANNSSWLKPLNRGRISSLYGYRTDPISKKWSLHNGIDIAGNSEGTKVYSSTAGYVAAVTKRSACGGNKVYVHSIVNGQKYTVAYVHLLTINVSVGDTVTNQTVIGTVGGGAGTKSYDSCSTGAHLHFAVAKGFYLGTGYSSYSTYVANSINPPGFPGKGVWFYSRIQWFN